MIIITFISVITVTCFGSITSEDQDTVGMISRLVEIFKIYFEKIRYSTLPIIVMMSFSLFSMLSYSFIHLPNEINRSI